MCVSINRKLFVKLNCEIILHLVIKFYFVFIQNIFQFYFVFIYNLMQKVIIITK